MEKRIFNIFVGIGSGLIVFPLFYLLFNLNDRAAMLALPMVFSGVSIIAVYLFLVSCKFEVLNRQGIRAKKGT